MQFALVSRDILFLNFNINAFGEHIIHLTMLSQPNIAFGYQCRGSNWMLYLCTSIVNLYIDAKIEEVYRILFVSGRTAPTRTNRGPFPNTMD